MVFQAMSEYQIHAPDMNEVNMDVTLSLPGRDSVFTWKINTENAMLQRSGKVTPVYTTNVLKIDTKH